MTKEQKNKKEKVFEATGTMQEAGAAKKFTRSLTAFNEGHARQKLLSLLGSNHAVKRRDIKIDGIREGEGS